MNSFLIFEIIIIIIIIIMIPIIYYDIVIWVVKLFRV
jgi:hypothetical protein